MVLLRSPAVNRRAPLALTLPLLLTAAGACAGRRAPEPARAPARAIDLARPRAQCPRRPPPEFRAGLHVTCPNEQCGEYAVSVRGDGEFEFRGVRGVPVLGEHRGRVTREELIELYALVDRPVVKRMMTRPEPPCDQRPADAPRRALLIGDDRYAVANDDCINLDERAAIDSITRWLDALLRRRGLLPEIDPG